MGKIRPRNQVKKLSYTGEGKHVELKDHFRFVFRDTFRITVENGRTPKRPVQEPETNIRQLKFAKCNTGIEKIMQGAPKTYVVLGLCLNNNPHKII